MKHIFSVACLVSCVSGIILAQQYGPPKPGYPVVGGRITQEFNVPWVVNRAQQHTGLDIMMPKGAAVYATKAGQVTKVNGLGIDPRNNMSWGDYIVVEHSDGTANGYLHVTAGVQAGQKVSAGQWIGSIYNDHLHYNWCYQAKGCQRGAFPNPDFAGEPIGNITKYYLRPRI